MVRELVMVSVVIAGVAIAAPKVFTAFVGADAGSIRAERRADAEPRRTVTRTWNSGRGAAFHVEIEAAANGHFYLDAIINRSRTRVMLDTGASIVALRQSDAAAAGIRPHRDDFAIPLQTANGISYGASAKIDSIVVDHIEIRDVEAVVIPDDQLVISLLGTNFLSRLERFEVSGSVLIIEN